ncbi:MAG: hypothetical protein ABIN08_12110 [Caldimonas sp.]
MSKFGHLNFGHRMTDKDRVFKGLRRGAAGLVVGLALAFTTSGAWAGTGDKSISVSVTRLPEAVSYSVTSLTQNTYAAYKVTVKSVAKSGASNVWFKSKATTATFKQSTNNACLADAGDLTAVTCELGPISFNQTKEFVLVFDVPNAPVPPAVGQICTLQANLGSECIAFDWRIANGQGTANNQPSDSQFSQSQRVETTVSVADTSGDSSSVQSYILVGGAAGTEAGVLSTELADQKAKTTATVPKNAPIFIEQKETSSNKGSCQNIYVMCFTTELRIQDGGAAIQFGNTPSTALLVTLLRDISTLKNANTAIDKAILRYSENGRTFTDIQACNLDASSPPVAVLPPGQINCLVSRSVEGSKWRFDLIASQNGFREF